MRKKQEITKLEELANSDTIEFPSANNQFSRFRKKLRYVIDENLGIGVGNTLEYLPSSQVFYVTIEASGVLLMPSERDDIIDGANTTLKLDMLIDPRESLLPQIKRIIEFQEALQKRHNLLGALLSFHKAGYKMAQAKEEAKL